MHSTAFKLQLHTLLFGIIIIAFFSIRLHAQNNAAPAKGRVLILYNAKDENAHLSFVYEACDWFRHTALDNGFALDTSSNWDNLNTKNLNRYRLVLFLDSRTENPLQRKAFEDYMNNGGAWMGFHFAGFALTPSEYPQNWDWYHNKFLGSGCWLSNTWRPTPAILRVEAANHPVCKDLPHTFKSSANEWYRWTNDLTKNPDIKILLAIDSASFPLGTGPKPHEIWHSGYYPVVWTNVHYNMVYFNMGHNDLDYENKTNAQLSWTFRQEEQNHLFATAFLWLVEVSKKGR